MTKTAKDHNNTKASDPDSDVVPPDNNGDDDLRLSPNIAVSHGGPNLIEDDEPPARNTRAAQRQNLLSAVNISGSCPTAQQCAQRRFPLQFLTDYASAFLDKSGKLLEYRQLIQRAEYKDDWGHSFGNEIGRLAQGMPGRNTGTNTLFFIHKHKVPPERW